MNPIVVISCSDTMMKVVPKIEKSACPESFDIIKTLLKKSLQRLKISKMNRRFFEGAFFMLL